MADLLLELFSEEIPARMQARAAADLEKLVNQHLIDAGFMPEGVKGFATPRRLSLVVTGLPVAQPDRKEERKGPRVGAPEKAVEGFLKSAGLDSLDECEIREDKKGQFYVAQIEEKGKDTAAVIAGFMPELIRKFPWPKSMRWGDGDLRWVRPLHSILCAFDGEIVEFEVDGIKASDRTYGHRFMAPDEIQVRNFDDYAAALKRAKVVLDTEERRETIIGEAEQLCKAQGLELVEDKGLLDEVAGLAEWPVVMIGTFDEKFLTVPDEALTASMRGHQKYFSVRDPKTGKLANKFVYVANIEAPDGGAAMRTGYERVLTARLSDAWFLYQQDLKKPLAEHAKKLETVTFFEGLGTVADKVERIAMLGCGLANFASIKADEKLVDKAARLIKADLVTQMVYEFPELQGLMGAYYAQAEGLPQEIVDAIRDHYKPVGQGDDVPTAPITILVSLGDKLDTLVAFWAIGKKPTGSGDPFALRRAALGVIRIILENKIRIPEISDRLMDVVWHLEKNGHTLPGETEQVGNEVFKFLLDRLAIYLREAGFRHDQIDAVMQNPRLTDDAFFHWVEEDIVFRVELLKGLDAFIKTDDGANLMAAYKRAANILKAEEKKGFVYTPIEDREPPFEPFETELKQQFARLTEPTEQALIMALGKAHTSVRQSLEKEDFEAAMLSLAELRGPLDAFFEDVTVNVDNAALRNDRLALLSEIKNTCEQVADLSRLEG